MKDTSEGTSRTTKNPEAIEEAVDTKKAGSSTEVSLLPKEEKTLDDLDLDLLVRKAEEEHDTLSLEKNSKH